MSLSHTVGMTYTADGTRIAATTATYTGDTGAPLDVVIPANSTNLEFDISFVSGDIVSLGIFSQRMITIKTNDSGSPDDQFDVQAGQLLTWANDSPQPNPFQNTVTKMFVTNAAGSTSILKMRILLNTEVAPD